MVTYDGLECGIYEQIINRLVKSKIDSLDRRKYYVGEQTLSPGMAIRYLSLYLSRVVERIFASVREKGNESESEPTRTLQFVNIVNGVISYLSNEFQLEGFEDDLVETGGKLLNAIVDKTLCDYADIAAYIKKIRPETTITSSYLFTGTRNNSISLLSELKREISSSDSIDFVISFIKQSGLNGLFNELKEFCEHGGRLRVITTTYTQATDYKAVLKLATLPNCEIKISYDENITRLHAKSYIFLRKTGFDTAYIGSSNMSGAALGEGTEWNIKITQEELPQMMSSVKNSFESMWQCPAYETFVLGRDNARLEEALSKDKHKVHPDFSVEDFINAKEYQDEILEELDRERILHDNYHNLIVAATGTGKTMISAFDYKRYAESHPGARLLFVAHREEILKQACKAYQKVMKDVNFGDLWYNGVKPEKYDHLFASKDMLSSKLPKMSLSPEYYDYIVIDEAHHITADSYQGILDYFKPKILLGLTATPERMDGQDITRYFGNTISAEIRLATAINNQLLVPFHYYGVSDGTNLKDIKWRQGKFDTEALSKLYIQDTLRTQLIINSLNNYLANPRDVKALCFCVNQEHAKFMNRQFHNHGLESDYLVSENGQERQMVLKRFETGRINYLFVVDMFNEGVDIPAIDTVLFLRPTESLTVYLQQLGRGLRKHEGKEFLTVLDYVGQTRAEFNYAARFEAIQGKTSISSAENIERGFPQLPLGCTISLEEKAKETILENIKQHLQQYNKNKLVQNVRTFGEKYDVTLNLKNFLKIYNLPLSAIYKSKKLSWTELKHLAGLTEKADTNIPEISRAVINKWLATDSVSYFRFIKSLADRGFKEKEQDMGHDARLMAVMLYYDLFEEGRFSTIDKMFEWLSVQKNMCEEISEVMGILIDNCKALEEPDNSRIASKWPLKLHATYTKSQVMAAMGKSTMQKKESDREGVKRSADLKAEAMFVDIIKDREEGSSTNYNDYAQSRTLFNWETQSTVSQDSPTGQNYINGVNTMLLFVRKQATRPEDKNLRMGYTYMGEVKLVKYEGNKPINILWQLQEALPACVFEYAAKYLAG